jgi:hypothetical protein
MEKTIEKEFRDKAIKAGCKVVKYVDPAKVGGPDRLVMLPGGRCFFVEFKKPDKTPRRDQIEYMLDLNRMGFLAFWATTAAEPLSLINTVSFTENKSELLANLCVRSTQLLERQL